MEARFAKRIIRRLTRLPFFRLILRDRLFGCVVALFGTLPLVFVLALPRIWLVSPAWIDPRIRVSGLDLVQAWSLKRNARRDAGAGEFEKASFAWLTACANNRADADSLRGFLRSFVDSGGMAPFEQPALKSAFWLLKLTATNRSDLSLAGEVIELCKAPDLLVELLESSDADLPIALEKRYLKALFDLREMGRFKRVWNRSQKRHSQDNELLIYRAAFLAGWGDFDEKRRGLVHLDHAAESGPWNLLANRLQLAVSARQLDRKRYERALKNLKGVGAESIGDYIGYWRLLFETGGKSEARKQIKDSREAPSNAQETVALARLLREVGLVAEALDVFRNAPSNARASQAYWTCYADVLVEDRRWEELRRIAFRMRRENLNRNRFEVLSCYLEGRAELGLGRERSAESAFQRMLEWSCEDPRLRRRICQQLILLNRPQWALRLLSQSNDTPLREAADWALSFEAANRARDAKRMLEAAVRWYQLSPDSPEAQQNYAAALLINREEAGQAVRLTWLLKDRYPHSRVAALNHAAALSFSGRLSEAQSVFSGIDTNVLTSNQFAVYQLNQLAIDVEMGRYEDARDREPLIERALLFEPQEQWLSRLLERLPEPENVSHRITLN